MELAYEIVAVAWIMSGILEQELNVYTGKTGEFCTGNRDLWGLYSISQSKCNK
jgi:hypothetical protein